MGSDRQSIERIREIFYRAQHVKAGEQRDEFLRQACGDDTALCNEVKDLLKAYESTCDFLSRDVSGEPLIDQSDLIGEKIGNYRILARLGEGGFGEVFRAEQTEPFRREVALKIIKLGMDTREVVARFNNERQALALMDHPNIAHVYDAGATDSGRPYFVMELVKGIPFLEYCDRHRFPLADRLKLFLQVCGAIQHAHQKGIIHRDIKPTNILVSEENDKPLPKVIDFGVAKSLEGRLTEETLITLQEMVLGTPAYMSPEQLNNNGDVVDTRTDVYSLGMILYELVAGATPLEGELRSPVSISDMRTVLENRESPRPSNLLRSLGGKTTAIAHARKVRIPTLQRLLRGDLDWVVMKAIEKDREIRYGDIGALSGDLERYLRNEPVLAGPPSLRYRLRKFFRRHQTGTRVAAAIVSSLLVAAAVAAWGYVQLTKPPPVVHVPGWKLEKFYDFGKMGANGFGLRPDGSVLVVGEWGPIEKGLYWARPGDRWSEDDAFSVGSEYIDPEAVIELADKIYVIVNTDTDTHLGSLPGKPPGKIFEVPSAGGKPGLFCEEKINYPYAILIAPETFDGPNVDPGDLIVLDNGHGIYPTVIWVVKRESGEILPLVEGNPLHRGFLSGCFSPDGFLYTGLHGGTGNSIGTGIIRVSPDGRLDVVLDRFLFGEPGGVYQTAVAVHPRTGEVFFCAKYATYAFIPGQTLPRLVLSKGEALQWAPDGSRLYLIADKAIWTLSGPGIATQPVSIMK